MTTKLSLFVTFLLLVFSYIGLAILFYVRLRIEILKWIFRNDWHSPCVKVIRTVLFGRVDVKKFKNIHMNETKVETELDPYPATT